jgi:hypothetical protein
MAGIFAGQMGKQLPSTMGQQPMMNGNQMDPGFNLPRQSMQGGGFQAQPQQQQAPPPGMDPAQFQRQMDRTQRQNDRTAMQAQQSQPGQQPPWASSMMNQIGQMRPEQMQSIQGGGLGQQPGQMQSDPATESWLQQNSPGFRPPGMGASAPPQQFDQEAWLQQNSPGFRPPEMGPPPGQMQQAVSGLQGYISQQGPKPQQQPRPMPQRPQGGNGLGIGAGGFKPQQPILKAMPSGGMTAPGQQQPKQQMWDAQRAARKAATANTRKPPGY